MNVPEPKCDRRVATHFWPPIIIPFVDEVCLPLQLSNTRQYIAVLPSFLELSSRLPETALEDGTVGIFQPSSFVLQGLSSPLTRDVALQYVQVARKHHGKLEIEDDSKIFFHYHKTRVSTLGKTFLNVPFPASFSLFSSFQYS